jgi:segregation and condensation protein B
MEKQEKQAIIEAILFAAGRQVEIKELMAALEINEDEIREILEDLKNKLNKEDSGIELIRVENSYQLCTKTKFYEYIYPIFDKRSKPNLSPAALETISIIAYNPNVTRAEIESIRGVGSDGSIYKLLEYELIEEAGRMDAPGRPTMYKVSPKFFKMFGIESLDELPELPRYKLDENQQIVLDDIIEEQEKKSEEDKTEDEENKEATENSEE